MKKVELDLKTKLTNTNRILVKPKTAIEQNRCYK